MCVRFFNRLPLYYCCTPTAYVHKCTSAVYRSILCTYIKMHTCRQINAIRSRLSESTYSTGRKHNKQQQARPRLNFLLEKGGAFPTTRGYSHRRAFFPNLCHFFRAIFQSSILSCFFFQINSGMLTNVIYLFLENFTNSHRMPPYIDTCLQLFPNFGIYGKNALR